MRVYLAIWRMSFRRQRAYRAANVAGLITNAFFGVVRSAVFVALYETRPSARGYNLGDALGYVWASQALIMPLYLWGWFEIALTVRSGDVATDLARPVDYFGYWLSRDAGRAAYHLLYRWLPTMAIGALFFGTRLPARASTLPLFALSFALALVISFSIRFLLNVTAFWALDARGAMTLSIPFINLLGGFLVPIEFFPPAARSIALALPFAGLVSTPVNVLLEREAGPPLWLALGRQALWAALLVLASRLVLRLAVRRLRVQGG
jgi:ABC-2 type transport system permease protein